MLLGGLIGTTAALALAGVAVLPGWLLLPARSSESPASSGSSSSGQWGCGLGHVTTARVCYGIHVAAGACENMSAVGLSQISLRASGCGTLFCSFVLSDPKITAQKGFRAIQDFRQAERQPVQPPQASTRGDQSPAVNSKGDTAIGYGAPPAPVAGVPRSPALDQWLSPGSAHTEGNQSPAVNLAATSAFNTTRQRRNRRQAVVRDALLGHESPACFGVRHADLG
jgi:hypothetical protein